MESPPPPKRRRTSPRLSAAATIIPTDAAAAAAGSRTTPPDPPLESATPRSNRPSFASPTRASLAKHNPEILERRKSLARSRVSVPPRDVTLSTEREIADERAAAADLPEHGSDLPRRTVRRSPLRSSPTRALGSTFSQPPRRSPVKPVPRPLPPPDVIRDEDVVQSLMAREIRRTGLDLFRTDEAQVEPELPPTPEHPDPELTTSPPGIHHSTPTKRPMKHRAMNGQKFKASSPLKQRPFKPPIAKQAKLGPALLEKVLPPQVISAESDTAGLRRDRSRSRDRNTTAATRGLNFSEPEAENLAGRNALLEEIRGLEADIAIAAAENERIRQATMRRLNAGRPANKRQIISLLRRRALPAEEEKIDPTAQWLQAAAQPIAFLPFGKPTAHMSDLLSFSGGNGADDAGHSEASSPPPLSHHPISMTAEEELPFLRAFTPLTLQSQIVVLPQPPANDASSLPLLQKHFMTASSANPPGLFIARIEMTVNARSLRITDLAVPRIDPPAAAAELQPLFDRITAAGGRKVAGSALMCNVTVLTWAMGEWLRVAVRRAKFWCLLDRKLGAKAALSESVRQLRTARRRSLRKRRRQQFGSSHDDDDEDDSDGADDELNGDTPTSAATSVEVSEAELRQHLGRTALDIHLPVASSSAKNRSLSSSSSMPPSLSGIRVLWRIDFDWTGEAQSQLDILVGLPGKWRKTDERGSLAKLPKLFDKLVRSNEDPAVAVQTIVALLSESDV